MSENLNMTYQKFGGSVKVVLRRKFIAINTYIIKQKRSQINLTLQLKELEKEKQTKPKTREGKK